MAIYAKIQSGVVVNTQVCAASDPMDPAYIWVDVTSLQAPGTAVGPEYTYDGTTFTAPVSS